MKCPLCATENELFLELKQNYFKCLECGAIYVDKKQLPDNQSEKQRYELHDTDTDDPGYRKFISPITSSILKDFTPEHRGLDFGAGTSAIISKVLHEQGYDLVNYDPYFHPNTQVLEKDYDYISSCEAIEHFYEPYKEFKLLKSLLKKGSKLYLMTDLYDEGIDFAKWYYKNDPTHVFFYSQIFNSFFIFVISINIIIFR